MLQRKKQLLKQKQEKNKDRAEIVAKLAEKVDSTSRRTPSALTSHCLCSLLYA